MGREQFDNTVKVEWLEEDRRMMRLLETVRFTDSKGVVWVAQEQALIDGASIPKFFWRVIGSPFIGYYRRPSVIHDVYCVNQMRPAQDVHDCFYEMMIADGVPAVRAKTMFEAVDKFGPRW